MCSLGAMSKKAIKKCSSCGGKGMKIEMRHVGPGMVQQVQSECHACGGMGEQISPSDKCGGCVGKKVLMETARYDLKIPAGCANQDKLVSQTCIIELSRAHLFSPYASTYSRLIFG